MKINKKICWLIWQLRPITTDFDRPAILDYQLPALGAEAAGSTAVAAPSTIKASKSRALGVEKKGLHLVWLKQVQEF